MQTLVNVTPLYDPEANRASKAQDADDGQLYVQAKVAAVDKTTGSRNRLK